MFPQLTVTLRKWVTLLHPADFQRYQHTLCGVCVAVVVFLPQGFPTKALTKLEDYGFIQSRAKGEYHANNQTMSKLLHKAIGLGSGSNPDPSAYEAYMAHFESAPPHVLRDCLMLETGGMLFWAQLCVLASWAWNMQARIKQQQVCVCTGGRGGEGVCS